MKTNESDLAFIRISGLVHCVTSKTASHFAFYWCIWMNLSCSFQNVIFWVCLSCLLWLHAYFVYIPMHFIFLSEQNSSVKCYKHVVVNYSINLFLHRSRFLCNYIVYSIFILIIFEVMVRSIYFYLLKDRSI